MISTYSSWMAMKRLPHVGIDGQHSHIDFVAYSHVWFSPAHSPVLAVDQCCTGQMKMLANVQDAHEQNRQLFHGDACSTVEMSHEPQVHFPIPSKVQKKMNSREHNENAGAGFAGFITAAACARSAAAAAARAAAATAAVTRGAATAGTAAATGATRATAAAARAAAATAAVTRGAATAGTAAATGATRATAAAARAAAATAVVVAARTIVHAVGHEHLPVDEHHFVPSAYAYAKHRPKARTKRQYSYCDATQRGERHDATRDTTRHDATRRDAEAR